MRITTPFGAATTAEQVVQGLELPGTRIVVTGAASGIGVETARALARTGAEVTLAVRDVAAGDAVAADITASTGNANVRVGRVDLSDRASIDAFTRAWEGPLHVLVNNAGIMATPETRNDAGWETQFATNHLGHFALTCGLRGALAEGAPSRVVNVSSIAHRRSPVVFDDINFAERAYEKWAAYAQSKTANVLCAVAITQRWADDGITANALHPGGIMTNLQRHMDPEEFRALGWVDADGNLNAVFKTPEQGAATTVLLATSALVDGEGGRYFEDCNEAEPATPENRRSGVEAFALDPEASDRLWRVSEQALG